MSKNKNLINAQKAKRDEFFTTREAVENELKYYPDCFKGKVVYCNCDDPHTSEFFKYFITNFKRLGLKALYCTCYEGSKASQLRLNQSDEEYQGKPYKAIILEADINTIIDEYGELTRETAERYINEHDKIEILKGNGSFDSPECLELLNQADVVVTNPPFSLFRVFVKLLMEYNKKFLIIANKNAITYKEVFPLFKDNKLWLGYTQPKEFMTPTGEISKKLSGLTRWFTNLDIPKRHEDLILWKKYSPDEYPHYDNYDAINVDRVADIPCDYVESWGLYQEEYNELDKQLWQTVRREQINGEEVIYVIPAKETELRNKLHNHTQGYKEDIEKELINTIYCNGCIGAPVTILDKHKPSQLEIVKFRTGNDGKDLAYTLDTETQKKNKQTADDYALLQNHRQKDTVTESSEFQLHSLTNGVLNNLELSDFNHPQDITKKLLKSHYLSKETLDLVLKEKQHMQESLSQRYCNGVIGVPVSFINYSNIGDYYVINHNSYKCKRRMTYQRLIIQRKL